LSYRPVLLGTTSIFPREN